MSKTLHIDVIRREAADFGLQLVGGLSNSSANRALTNERDRLDTWQSRGFAGDMNYMNRDSAIFCDLERFLESTKSVLLFALPYAGAPARQTHRGFARVARYAWGEDYHLVLRSRLEDLARRLQCHAKSQLRYRTFTDAVPLFERALGAAARLGFVGRNTLLIRPGLGSYFFVGEMLLDCPVDFDALLELPGRTKMRGVQASGAIQAGEGCGSCRRCLPACPTNAFPESGILDARRCISYLTIEKRGNLSPMEARALGTWMFGCDICQEVCPFNANPRAEVIEEFAPDAEGHIELRPFMRLGASGFRARYQRSALTRAGYNQLLRNACCVVENTKYAEAIPEILDLFRETKSDMLRFQAARTLKQLLPVTDGQERARVQSALKDI